MHHPHLHFIVTGGGLSYKGDKWISSRKKFFLPVKVISRLFRGKFMSELKKLNLDGKLTYNDNIEYLQQTKHFKELLNTLYKKDWVSYCKPPFNNAEQVIGYLGRYTHRVAISNNRIKKLENGKVCFQWKDYKDGCKNKLRFLLHILPDKFVKIRYYGILSNRNRKKKLKICRKLLTVSNENIPAQAGLEEMERKFDYTKCPYCGIGVMVIQKVVLPGKNAPPQKRSLLTA